MTTLISSNMPSTEIPPEIWIRVNSFLRNPTPPSLSSPPRSAIMQPHLAEAACVSKLFQAIAERLYSHITTDRPWELCCDAEQPSKLNKLALVKTLRIEYCSKYQEATYRGVLCLGGDIWASCGLSSDPDEAFFAGMDDEDDEEDDEDVEGSHRDGEEEDEEEEDDEADETIRLIKTTACNREMNDLLHFLAKVRALGPENVFPKLHTIAVSSLFGGVYWGETTLPPISLVLDNTQSCMVLFDSLLSRSPVKHLCLRSMQGPLSIVIRRNSLHPNTLQSRTVHFSSEDYNIPIPFGVSVK